MLEADVMTPVTASKLKLHPVTEKFPPLSDEEYKHCGTTSRRTGFLTRSGFTTVKCSMVQNRLKACVN